MNWYQQQVADGERRGELRGEMRGRAIGWRKGVQRVVLIQLRARFGELPAAVVARVEAAGVPELDLWVERVVTASRLEDVLA